MPAFVYRFSYNTEAFFGGTTQGQECYRAEQVYARDIPHYSWHCASTYLLQYCTPSRDWLNHVAMHAQMG